MNVLCECAGGSVTRVRRGCIRLECTFKRQLAYPVMLSNSLYN